MTTTDTTQFTPRIQSFAVSVKGWATFHSSPSSYVFALKRAAEMRALGLEAEVVAVLSGLPGTMDVAGAILYDGSTWTRDAEGWSYPAIVNGIVYRALDGETN